jgi:hypothetical protein
MLVPATCDRPREALDEKKGVPRVVSQEARKQSLAAIERGSKLQPVLKDADALA